MSFSIIRGALASAVAPAGTFTASYPTGKDKGSFFLAMGHKLSVGGNELYYPKDFDVTLGDTSITVTNKTSAYTWPAAADFILQMEEPGARPIVTVPQNNPNVVTSSIEGQGGMGGINNLPKKAPSTSISLPRILHLGAPDVLDADGVCAAQAISGATNATINGALASSGVATMDVPRGLQVLSSNGGDTTQTVTITGTDAYGFAMVETIALNGTTARNGLKAFKTVTTVAVSAVMAGNLTVGTTDILGLPEFIPSSGYIVSELRDGVKVGPGGAVALPFFINQTDLLAPVSQQVYSPVAGVIDRLNLVIQGAIATGGNVTVTAGGNTVTGLAIAITGSAAVGTAYTDQPTAGAANATVTAGTAIAIVPDASFATSGAVNGSITIQGALDGTFVAGIRTGAGSTATTGDVRGTYKPSVACDGSTVFDLVTCWSDDFAGIKQFTS